jgi:hypothetical protein
MQLNHYPLPIGRKVPSHGATGDTANPNAAITCPHCRAMLERKVAAHSENAKTSRSAQERQFFTADAAHWQALLTRTAA